MSKAPSSHYAADFTAVVEGNCETCGTTTVLKHMQNKDRSKPGRDLCPDCYQYYRNKTGTVRRSSAQTPHVEHSTSHRHDVHRQVAQAQRGRK
jgi:ribosome-binding protein aMBF1 (putative translation factor)